jgi:glyoxylase-like metal-dependent hydrolase (beta-lactamase superfamily II)
MRIHHLSCGTMCPLGGRLMDGFSHGAFGHLVCHCLLIETEQGLVLVDTGFGTRDAEHPFPRLSRLYVDMLRIHLDMEQTALRQIQQLGFSASDVRHIVLTHLDFDHAGGLEDFPQAVVHVMEGEFAAALDRDGFVGKRRYRPKQWDEVRAWQRYHSGGERWFGFSAVRDLQGLPPEILLVPLAGHTHGHAGVAIKTDGDWLLHAGDAYFYRGEMERRPYCTPGLRAYQRLMEVDRQARLHNQGRLRQLAHNPDARVNIFCAHDAIEFEMMQALTAQGAASGSQLDAL